MLQLVSSAVGPVLTLEDVKSHLGIVGSQDDVRVTNLINAACDYIERDTGRDLLTKTWVEVFDRFPTRYDDEQWRYNWPLYPWAYSWFWNSWQHWRRDSLFPLRYPVQSVVSLQYYDTTNTLQTLTQGTDFYAVVGTNRRALLRAVTSWPEVYARPDAVQLKYTTGGTVPEAAKHAIRLLVGAWSENREDFYDGRQVQVPIGVDRLCDQLRTMGYV